jgi:hypothetical protein
VLLSVYFSFDINDTEQNFCPYFTVNVERVNYFGTGYFSTYFIKAQISCVDFLSVFTFLLFADN